MQVLKKCLLINRIRFTEETVFGKSFDLPNINKVQGIIIRLRKNENVEKSKNTLIAMLEELLKKESADDKKKILSDEYLKLPTTFSVASL